MGTPHFVIRPGQGQSPAGGSPVLAGTCRPVLCPLSSAVDRPACQLPCVGRDPRLVRAAVERAPHPCVSLSHSSTGVHNPASHGTLGVRVVAPSFCPPNDLIPIDVCCALRYGAVPGWLSTVASATGAGRYGYGQSMCADGQWPSRRAAGDRRRPIFPGQRQFQGQDPCAVTHAQLSAQQDQCKYHVPYVQFENFRKRGAPRAGARPHNRLIGHSAHARQTAFCGQAAGAYAKTHT